jgi:DNA polymerase-3 subunit delta'
MPFRDVIGHRSVVALLARSAVRGSLPPSLIFAGPSGVGKRLTAVAVAQALNCLNPLMRDPVPAVPAGGAVPAFPALPASSAPDVDACGTCASCTRIARGVHPDVILIEPGDSGTIKIDSIRDVVDKAAYRPFEGRRRVVVVDEADALVPAAQNALLKTLEEPPSASMFVLVTARPDALLATVQSRCPRLRFRALDPDDVAAVLMKRGRTEIEARAIASTADGSIGRALNVSAGEFVESRDVAVRVLKQVARSDDPRRRIDVAKDLLPKASGSGRSDREQLATYLRSIASLLRDVELIAADADRGALANPGVQTELEGLAAFRGARGVQAFATVDRALVALDRNAGVKTVVDWVLVNV